jgi:hypothetical protein
LGVFDCISDIAWRPIEHPKGFSAMEYKQFVVQAYEREPVKWRACIERAKSHHANSESPPKIR